MWPTSEYKVRLHNEAVALQRRHTGRGGGQLCFVHEFGDLDGLYTNISTQRLNEALRTNIHRVKDSAMADVTRCETWTGSQWEIKA
jgi:hypothetical protein